MDGTRFLVAGSFIDGISTVVRKNVVLTVKGGIITAIGSMADLTGNAGSAIDDLSHCTILPALVDCSVSLSRSPSIDRKVRLLDEEAGFAEKTGLLEKHLNYCHAYGVQGVADSNDITDLIARYQKNMPLGCKIDIRTSCHPCSSKQGHVTGKSSGGDFLKIYYSGNIDDDKASYRSIDQKTLGSILQQRRGKKAVVVANGEQKVKEALDAGCDAIEQGYAMGEDNLRRMAEKGVLWIPSVLRAKNGLDSSGSSGDVCCRFSQRYVAPGKPVAGAEEFWKKVLSEQLTQLRLARKLGVTTAAGTGAGSVGILHGESMAEEMKLFIRAGYSLEEAIRCASENGARFFSMERLGALTVGRNATFLVTRGSVMQLPRKLSYLESIYVDGLPSDGYHK